MIRNIMITKFELFESKKIKESWRDSQFDQSKIELIPTEWVWKYSGKNLLSKTELSNGKKVDLDELWENILKEGLLEPLIMRIGIKNKKFRLESGNHRIQVLYKNKIEKVPVIVQIKDECGPQTEDAMTDSKRNYDFENNVILPSHIEEYMKPSDIFSDFYD